MTTAEHLHALVAVADGLLDDADPDRFGYRPERQALEQARRHLLELAGQQPLPGLSEEETE